MSTGELRPVLRVTPLSSEATVAPLGATRSVGPAVVVWGVWLAALAGALFYVAHYANDLPHRDEWRIVSVATNGCPREPKWFLAPNNEHRIPLPKAVYCALMAVSGGDFRAGTLLSVAMFGAVAAGLMIAVSRFRGRVAVQDAFFPLLLLHWGHGESFLLSFQIAFTIPVALAAAAAGVLLSDRARESLLVASFVVACAVLMPWSSVVGLVLAPALVPWLVWSGRAAWRTGTKNARRIAFVLGSGAATSAASTAYLLLRLPRTDLPSPGFAADVRVFADLVLNGLGPAAPHHPLLYGAFVVMLAVAILFLAVRELAAAPLEGRRAVGLLLLVGAVLALLAGLAHSRAGFSTTVGAANRYVSIGALLYLGLFLLASLAPRAWAARLQIALALLVLGAAPVDYANGRELAADLSARIQPVFRDARAGAPPAVLAERHGERLVSGASERWLARQLSRMCTAQVGPYRFLRSGSAAVVGCGAARRS